MLITLSDDVNVQRQIYRAAGQQKYNYLPLNCFTTVYVIKRILNECVFSIELFLTRQIKKIYCSPRLAKHHFIQLVQFVLYKTNTHSISSVYVTRVVLVDADFLSRMHIDVVKEHMKVTWRKARLAVMMTKLYGLFVDCVM